MTHRVFVDLSAFQSLCRGHVAHASGIDTNLNIEEEYELVLKDVDYDQMKIASQRPTIDLIEKHGFLAPDKFLRILDAMEKRGGAFVKALAEAARHADQVNRVRIVMTWVNYFMDYDDAPVS